LKGGYGSLRDVRRTLEIKNWNWRNLGDFIVESHQSFTILATKRDYALGREARKDSEHALLNHSIAFTSPSLLLLS